MKQAPQTKVDGNRYKMHGLAVSNACHITLAEALSLTLVEAYLALGYIISGN